MEGNAQEKQEVDTPTIPPRSANKKKITPRKQGADRRIKVKT